MSEVGRRARVFLVGERPRELAWLLGPTALAVALDLALRARALASFGARGKSVWASSLLVSAAFWALPLWAASRWRARERARAPAAVAFVACVLPIATFAYGGQALYFRVFHAYMGRDTVRLGVALRGTLRDWLFAWQSPAALVAMLALGAVATAVLFAVYARAPAPVASSRVPALLVLAFVGAGVCFWADGVDSRFLQAATPDACFVHGVVRAARVALGGDPGAAHRGMSLRTPASLRPLASATRARPPNVLVVLTESVRADATCSRPPPDCRSPFLDDVVPDRVALGNLTTQTPSTFGTWMMLLTGLGPTADFHAAHAAPVLWELARAVGYRTAYVSAQNMRYADFGAYVERAGIDVLVTPAELGGVADEQLGAPDELATARALAFTRDTGARPWFAIVHLSNTHAPYRTDPSLLPFTPESDAPLGDPTAFHNHYRNAVRLQERTVAGFLRELRASPAWDDTVVLFLSDHGEQFVEHGQLYHNHSLYEEELRVPGWIVAGARALDADERRGLATWGAKRTYTQDVHATIVDLFGLAEAAPSLPFGDRVGGRSLVAPRPAEEPFVLVATSTAVWESDTPLVGGFLGGVKVIGTTSGAFTCIDTERHPSETTPFTGPTCDALVSRARAAFSLK